MCLCGEDVVSLVDEAGPIVEQVEILERLGEEEALHSIAQRMRLFTPCTQHNTWSGSKIKKKDDKAMKTIG
jgi:hypothetical protein